MGGVERGEGWDTPPQSSNRRQIIVSQSGNCFPSAKRDLGRKRKTKILGIEILIKKTF